MSTAAAPGSLPVNATTNASLRYSGSAWVENAGFKQQAGGSYVLGNGSIANVGGSFTSTDSSFWTGPENFQDGLYQNFSTTRLLERVADRNLVSTATARMDRDATEHRFYTNSIERMRLLSSGRMTLGAALSTDSTRLRVRGVSGDTSVFQAVLQDNVTSGVDIREDGFHSPQVWQDTTATGDRDVVMSTSAPGGKFQTVVSSRRYKENINPLRLGLEDVLKLQPVSYTLKGETTLAGGLIAEELHDAGLGLFVNYDEEGRPDGVQYRNLVALLVNAIKELAGEVRS
jgi:hypothetical protein